MKEGYNWILANPIIYDEPIGNVKGKLSFWEYDGPLVQTKENVDRLTYRERLIAMRKEMEERGKSW